MHFVVEELELRIPTQDDHEVAYWSHHWFLRFVSRDLSFHCISCVSHCIAVSLALQSYLHFFSASFSLRFRQQLFQRNRYHFFVFSCAFPAWLSLIHLSLPMCPSFIRWFLFFSESTHFCFVLFCRSCHGLSCSLDMLDVPSVLWNGGVLSRVIFDYSVTYGWIDVVLSCKQTFSLTRSKFEASVKIDFSMKMLYCMWRVIIIHHFYVAFPFKPSIYFCNPLVHGLLSNYSILN